MAKKHSEEELIREIQDEDEASVFSAIDKQGVDTEIEIIDHKGRKLKIRAKKIDLIEAVDDREGYS